MYDINSRVRNHLYQATFVQLNAIHHQFAMTIRKLEAIRQSTSMALDESKARCTDALAMIKQGTLAAQCSQFIERSRMSYHSLEEVAKQYYKATMTDAARMLERYVQLVNDKFPIAFNGGTRLRQTIDSLQAHMMKNESFAAYVAYTIESLQAMHQALLGYTAHMFDVVNSNTKVMQLLGRSVCPFTFVCAFALLSISVANEDFSLSLVLFCSFAILRLEKNFTSEREQQQVSEGANKSRTATLQQQQQQQQSRTSSGPTITTTTTNDNNNKPRGETGITPSD